MIVQRGNVESVHQEITLEFCFEGYRVGLKELILLKWPYYPKQSTDLMQSLSKYP